MMRLKHNAYYAITVLDVVRYKIDREDTIGQYDAQTEVFVVKVGMETRCVPLTGVKVVQRLPT